MIFPPRYREGGRVLPLVIAQSIVEDPHGQPGAVRWHFDPVREERPREEVVQPEAPPRGITALPVAGTSRQGTTVHTDTTPTGDGSQGAARRYREPPMTGGGRRMRMATWNVRGCATVQVREAIDAELAARGVEVAHLQEVRMPQQRLHTENYRWFTAEVENRGHRGVAFLVRRGSENVRPRRVLFPRRDIAVLVAGVGGAEAFFVNAHVPSANNTRQAGVLNSLAATVASVPNTHWTFLGADTNAHIGLADMERPDNILGPELLHAESDVAGAGILAMARDHGLRIITTAGHGQARGCRVTWRNRTSESQIDHIMTNYNRVQGVFGVPPEQVPAVKTDHTLLVATIHLPDRPRLVPRAAVTQAPRRRPRGDWDANLLVVVERREAFQRAVEQGIDMLRAVQPEDPLTWMQLKGCLVTGATAMLRGQRSPITPNTQAAVNRQHAASYAAYREPDDAHAAEVSRAATAALRAARREHEETKAVRELAAIEEKPQDQRMRLAFRYLRKERRAGARARDGPTIREWTEALRPIAGRPPALLPLAPGEVPPDGPTAAQLQDYARKLTPRTAPGPDMIPNELLMHAPTKFYRELQRITDVCWRDAIFLEEWTASYQQPIQKVPQARRPGDFRMIALCNGIYKLNARHLLEMMQELLPPMRAYQAGFQAQRSCADHLFLLRRILDEHWRAGVSLYILALDIRQAFPSMSHQAMVQVLQERGVPAAVINIVLALACTERTRVRWGAATTEPVSRGRGLRQGCPYSPQGFVDVMDWAIEQAVAAAPQFSLTLDSPTFVPIVLGYADDLLIASRLRQDLMDIVPPLLEALRVLGLEVNQAKCQILLRGPDAEPPQPGERMDLGPIQVPRVESIVYLGSLITTGLGRNTVVQHRTRKGAVSTASILPALQRNPLPVRLIARLFQAIVLPSAAYALSTASAVSQQRAHMRRRSNTMLTSMLATARRPRRGLQELTPEQRRRLSLTGAVRRLRVRYWGHVLRRPQGHPLRRALELDLGWKKVGAPCHTFLTSLMQYVRRLPPPPQGWDALATDKTALARYVDEVDQEFQSTGSEEDSEDEDRREVEVVSDTEEEEEL